MLISVLSPNSGVFHGGRWPDAGGAQGAPGREGDGGRQQTARTVPAPGTPARA